MPSNWDLIYNRYIQNPSYRKWLWRNYKSTAIQMNKKWKRQRRKHGKYYEPWMGNDFRKIINYGGGKPVTTSHRNYNDRMKFAIAEYHNQWGKKKMNDNDREKILDRAKVDNKILQDYPKTNTANAIKEAAYATKDVANMAISATRLYNYFANFF